MKNWLPLVLGPGGQRVKREVRTQVALGRGKRGGSGTSIGHGQQERHVVLVLKVLVSKLLAVDALAWQGGGGHVPLAAAQRNTHLQFRCGW